MGLMDDLIDAVSDYVDGELLHTLDFREQNHLRDILREVLERYEVESDLGVY